jgi:hypothetical protein
MLKDMCEVKFISWIRVIEPLVSRDGGPRARYISAHGDLPVRQAGAMGL